MTKYRISVSFDKENFFWVVVDQGRFIRNPTKEDLIGTKLKSYNKTNICDRCREQNNITDKSILYPGSVCIEKDKDGNIIGCDCRNCWGKYDPNSTNNKKKLETDCRNKNLDPNSSPGIGYIAATLVKKKLGIDDCFDITDNFCYRKYDMIEHKDREKIDSKGSSLIIPICGKPYHEFGIHKNKKADFFFCIGFDKERKHILAIFIIQNDEYVGELEAINISYNGNSKWNKFKESEEEVKKWDELYHTMKLDNCPVLRKK